jgi:beta-phosphoglucomutase-like phosphatase (HAD superfamily)
MASPIRALLFDLDDTLVASEELNAALLRGFLRDRWSITLTPEQERETFWYAWMDTFHVLAAKFPIRGTFEEFWAEFFAVKKRWLSEHGIRVARGVERILSIPVPKAIVSGSLREEIDVTLAAAGIARETFGVIVSSEDCAKRKPDPEGFLRALQALGVAPRDALVFEDSPIGIQAARACGLPVAFMREFAVQDSCAAAAVCFDSFEQASAWVRDRLGDGPR